MQLKSGETKEGKDSAIMKIANSKEEIVSEEDAKPTGLDSEINGVTSLTEEDPNQKAQGIEEPLKKESASSNNQQDELVIDDTPEDATSEPQESAEVANDCECEMKDVKDKMNDKEDTLNDADKLKDNEDLSNDKADELNDVGDKKESENPVKEVSVIEERSATDGPLQSTEATEISDRECPNQFTTTEESELDDNRVKEFIQSKTREELQQFSDDEISLDGSSDDSSSNSESSSSSSESSDSSEEEEEEEENKGEALDELEEEDESGSGPIISKNEVSDETAPSLPADYQIAENSPLELVGTISAIVEKNIIVKASVSGEFRVLKDRSVLCLEDRQVLGPLFETFGRLQAPNYRIKFNTQEEVDQFKDKKGSKVFYVVPDSQFLYTDAIKKLKGTDASNCHDEELPEEEQEFSDDEQELAAKQEKKRKKKQKKTPQAAESEPAKKKQNTKPDHKFVSYGFAANQAPPSLPSTPQYAPQQKHHNPSLHVNSHAQPPQYASNPYGVPFNQVQANPYGQPFPAAQPQPHYYAQNGYHNTAVYQGQSYQMHQSQMQQQYQPYQQYYPVHQPMHYQQPINNMNQHSQAAILYQQAINGQNNAMNGQNNFQHAQWAQPNNDPSTLHQLQQLVANGLTQNQSHQNQNQQKKPE